MVKSKSQEPGAKSRRSSPQIDSVPADFDLPEMLTFLGPRAVPSLELVTAGAYTRSVRLDEQAITLSASVADRAGGPKRLVIRTAPSLEARRVTRLVRELFDLDTDLDAFRSHVVGDTILAPLVAARPTIRIPRYVDPFEGVVRAILGQQVSLAAARTMTDRLVRLTRVAAPALNLDLNDTSADADVELLAFPSARELLDLGPSRLQRIGLTGAKTRALLATAEAVLDGTLDWTWLQQAAPEEAQARLETVRGIGPWTAAYVRMRALGDRDAFPATDMGVIKAFAAALGIERPTTAQIVTRAERWRPWRAYATLQLWRSLGPGGQAPAQGAGLKAQA